MAQQSATRSQELPSYPIQLLDAHLYTARVERRERLESDPAEPTLNASFGAPIVSDDGRSIKQALAVRVLFPYNEGKALLELRCSVLGTFVSQSKIDPAHLRQREVGIILWPYLRAAASELARMTGLPLPPIPTLDVTAIVQAAEPTVGAPSSPGVKPSQPRYRRRRPK